MAQEKLPVLVDLSTQEKIKDFIHNTESSLYGGRNVDGEQYVMYLQQGEEMTIKTIKHGKPDWYQVTHYNSDGFQECVSYEKIPKDD